MPRRLIPVALRIWPTEIALLLAGAGWLARLWFTPLLTLSSSFSVMARVPVGWWIALFAISLALLARGVITQTPWTRNAALVVWFCVWGFIAWLLRTGNPDAPGDTTYGALALAAGWAYLRGQWLPAAVPVVEADPDPDGDATG